MKRVAFPYDNRLGRDDGAPLYYSQVLKRDPNYEVVRFTSEDTGDIAKWGKFDAWVHADWGEDALKNMLPYTPMDCHKPSIYVPCDTHISDASRDFRFDQADKHDWVFFNQRRGAEEYLQKRPDRAGQVFWLPCAVEPLAYPDAPVAIKTYDIGFVGFVTFRKRVVALDRMFKEFPNFFYGQRFSRWIYGDASLFDGQDAADIFRKSKIVFNTAANDDINMRVFETMATGTFLLTERVPYLEELFEDKKHCVMYNNIDEAVELAKYYLEHEDEREAIAKAGHDKVLAEHTYTHRWKFIEEKTGLFK